MSSIAEKPAIRELRVLQHTISDAHHTRVSRTNPVYAAVISSMTKFKKPILVEIQGAEETVKVVGISNNGHGKIILCAAWDKGDPLPLPAKRLQNQKMWEEWTGEKV